MDQMDATEVVEAIKSIPEKKESLREAFGALQSSLSSLLAISSSSALTALQWKWEWKDVEDHISSIETSVLGRFSAAIKHTTTTDDDGDGSSKKRKKKEVDRSTAELLKSVCINMDAKGLQSFLNPDPNRFCNNMDAKGLRSFLNPDPNRFGRSRLHRKYSRFLSAIRDLLSLALRSFAPDPGLLILNTLYGSNPRKPPKHGEKGELLFTRDICIYLLEVLHPIALEFGIKPALRERALTLALKWKGKIPRDDKSMETATQALAFLRLLVVYQLTQAFEADYVIELLCVCIWRRSVDVNLVKNLGLANKAHDLIQKLNRKGRELDAVKIVHALNIEDKFPPVPLLKAYITRSKQRADELRKKGNNSVQAHNDATTMEMAALVSVLNAIEEYKLESEFPRENLIVRIAQLGGQKKADTKQAAASVAASSSKAQQQQLQQSKKRPRPSPATSVPAISTPVIAANSYPQSIQPHPQSGLAERAPYMGVAGPCCPSATGSVYKHGGPSLYSGLASIGSVYNHGGLSHSCITTDQGATRSPPKSCYSSESLAGMSCLYDRAVTYHGHHLDGLLSSYVSSLYP